MSEITKTGEWRTDEGGNAFWLDTTTTPAELAAAAEKATRRCDLVAQRLCGYQAALRDLGLADVSRAVAKASDHAGWACGDYRLAQRRPSWFENARRHAREAIGFAKDAQFEMREQGYDTRTIGWAIGQLNHALEGLGA